MAFASAWLLLTAAPAQQGGGQPGGAANPSTGGRRDTSRPPDRQQPGKPSPQFPQVIFISGTVVTGDGAPLPSGVIIERSCGGQVWKETTVDSGGGFNFQVGGFRTSNVLPDASDSSTFTAGMDPRSGGYSRDSGRFGDTDAFSSAGASLMGCELRARAGGFRSSSVMLQSNAGIGMMDIGTIVLYPIARVQGTTVSATNMQAPKAAKKALERGQKALAKKNYEPAEKELRASIDAYPNFAAAWYELGQMYQAQQKIEDARAAYKKAVELDSMYVSPQIQLAVLAAGENKWQEVADLTNHALKLNPLDFPHGFFLNALAYSRLNDLEAAERSARKALRLDGQHRMSQAFLLLADILEQRKDISGAMEQLRAYLKFAPNGGSAQQARLRLEQLEKSYAQSVSEKESQPKP
jgi:tetratricopeptide (TPR) repeat protein